MKKSDKKYLLKELDRLEKEVVQYQELIEITRNLGKLKIYEQILEAREQRVASIYEFLNTENTEQVTNTDATH